MLCLVKTHDFIFLVNTETDGLVEDEGDYQGDDKGVGATGLLAGNFKQLMIQLIAVVAAGAYAFIVTLIIAFVLDKTMGLRVDKEDEIMGLDQTQHSESGYNM